VGKLKESLINTDYPYGLYDVQPERQPEDLIAERMDWRLSEASTARNLVNNLLKEYHGG
jgi:hypothetical protein